MRRSVSFLVLAAGLATNAPAWGGEKLPEEAIQVDAREDVSQALLAEVQGDNAQRSKRLTKAWLAVPDLAEANWHLARVRVADQWKSLAEVVSQSANDSDQEQYRALREKATGNPRALRDLARWCTKHGWQDRARLHFAQLLALPSAEASQKSEAVEKLNLVQVGGGWLTKEEVQARQDEAKAIQDALAKWRPKLKALQEIIDGTDFAKRNQANAELDKLDDPAMIPALESFLLDGGADFQEQAVKKLAGFKHFEATESLVRYALLSDYSLIRDSAIQSLKRRPFHESVPFLLSGLAAPIKSQFSVAWDQKGRVAYSHHFFQEGSSANRLFVVYGLAVNSDQSSSTYIDKSVRVQPPEPSNLQSTTTKVGKSRQQAFAEQLNDAATRAANQETRVRVANAKIDSSNERLMAVLERLTEKQLGSDPAKWWTWWQGYNEVYWPKPTVYGYSSKAFVYSSGYSTTTVRTGTRNSSCFLAGTPIRTEMGTVPIESIRPGDRVLAQDQDTGELTYKVVLTTTLRPPAKMLEIQAGGEDIYTTLGHPFWVAGQGWRMAKQLKEGDLLHGLGGATPITSIVAAGEHAAHNLVVDDLNTYFVGKAGLLVHDNEFRKPTRAIVPGLVRD